MRRAFVSDLHLGDGSGAEDFHRDEEFINFLQWCDHRVGEIVILGDLFELWQADLQDIFNAHPDVIEAIRRRRRKIRYIYGNHDALPFQKLQPRSYETSVIYAEHGHSQDVWNSDHKNPLFNLRWPIGKYITLLVGELERWFCPDVDDWLEKQRERFGDFLVDAAILQSKSWDITDLDQVAQKIMDLQRHNPLKRKVCVYGHNHQAEVSYVYDCECINGKAKTKVDHVYANCGTWVDSEYPTFVLVDYELNRSDMVAVQLRDGLDPDEVLDSILTVW
jgi:UDP-2,3-diacylglucosamine pyrophosphatase LpxH